MTAATRRAFFGQSAAVATALGALALPLPTSGGTSGRRARDRVKLGRSGITVSWLAQGTGAFDPRNGAGPRVETAAVAKLLETGVERGLDFWDLADSYGTHPAARAALATVKRENVVLMTKSRARSAAAMRADVERFRKELGVDQIDLVLLHCLTDAAWTTTAAGAMDALAEAKHKGLVRAHGISCHSLAALEHATTTKWVDVVLARLNPVGAMMDTEAEEVIPVLARLKSQGKGIVGMKILGAGQLRQRIDEALAYAVRSPVLDAVTIGAANQAELDDLIRRIAQVNP